MSRKVKRRGRALMRDVAHVLPQPRPLCHMTSSIPRLCRPLLAASENAGGQQFCQQRGRPVP